MSNIVKYTYTITYEASVDTETGEVLSTKIVNKSEHSTKPVDNSEPTLTLEANKFVLSPSAISLIGAEVGEKLDIRYEQSGSTTIPVLGKSTTFETKGGTQLTKSNSCSFRGVKNKDLAARGSVFKVTPHPSKEGLFLLDSGKSTPEPPKVDEPIQVTDDIDFGISDVIDNVEDIEELTTNFFKL